MVNKDLSKNLEWKPALYLLYHTLIQKVRRNIFIETKMVDTFLTMHKICSLRKGTSLKQNSSTLLD